MPDPLLFTKLFKPSLRVGTVPRQRVTEKLSRGLTEGRRLTLVSAPAGYGKTTLVTEWLSCLPIASKTESSPAKEWKVAWLSLDEGDNDPARFFAYLVAALRNVDASIGQVALDLVSANRYKSTTTLVTTIINDVITSGHFIILVLDDYHMIQAPLIHDAVDYFCQFASPLLHLVITTRIDPPISLSMLRANGQLAEVRAQDLRFFKDEASAFFTKTMGLPVDPASVEKLTARTEGWIAGLQLAALSLQGCDLSGMDEFISAFNGSDRYIMDYLVEQVLRRLPPELHDFLHKTTILERFSAPLCDAILSNDGCCKGTHSKEMLNRLDQSNLFLVRLDTRGEWFRYHHLFAELLSLEVDENLKSRLHNRASAWFEANGYLSEAISHAFAACNYSVAARLIRLASGDLLTRSEFYTLRGWLGQLPLEMVSSDRELATLRAVAMFFTGEVAQANLYLSHLNNSTSFEGLSPLTRGRLLAIQAFIANLQSDHTSAQRFSQEALNLIGTNEPFYRMMALLPLGMAQEAAGETQAAAGTFQSIYLLGNREGHALTAAGGLFVLAKNLLDQGKRRQALAQCESALPNYKDKRGNPSPLSGFIYLPLALISYHGNELDRAWEYALMGHRLTQQIISEDIRGWDDQRVIAWVQYARGQVDEALATARTTSKEAEKANYVRWVEGFRSLEAELLLREGELAAVRRWAEEMRYQPGDTPTAEHEVAYRIYAHFLLADGRPLEARRLLAALAETAQTGGRYGRLIPIRILQSLTEEAIGEHDLALEYMTNAISIAAPEGFQRVFLDIGKPAIKLIKQISPVAPEFIDHLLMAEVDQPSRSQSEKPNISQLAPSVSLASQGMVESLTSREIEVLTLLAEGRSYQQIANTLIIALGTVRAHCSTIYSKLGVENRTQAIITAKEAGLL